ncbi:MAG: aldo/keto reductase [Acidobacteria bacterium]|nr:aldo/keto reductase [Acidobacteriota bacterium]
MMELGVGLIRIGREWGHVAQGVPAEGEAAAFLEHAFARGVTFYDTAPSYGSSESRTGEFLRTLTPAERGRITVATKFGEHWDAALRQPFVDHSFDALRRSIDQSLARLGRVDVLQLHKTTSDVLRSDDLARAWEYARSVGIARLGPSVSDLDSAALAVADGSFSVIQLPLNLANRRFEAPAREASARGMSVVANRPFAMGAMLYGDAPVTRADAFAYMLGLGLNGVILTGTADTAHLDENLAAFHEASAR